MCAATSRQRGRRRDGLRLGMVGLWNHQRLRPDLIAPLRPVKALGRSAAACR